MFETSLGVKATFWRVDEVVTWNVQEIYWVEKEGIWRKLEQAW